MYPMNKDEINYNFWKRFDILKTKKGFESLKEFSEIAKIPEQRMKNQRSKNQIPKIFDLLTISSLLNCSIEFLVTGQTESLDSYSIRVKKIAKQLTKLEENDLTTIERIVDVLPKK